MWPSPNFVGRVPRPPGSEAAALCLEAEAGLKSGGLRGYAGAATVEVSRAAIASGADEVLLFTDLANPTSNGLYQRIGYRPVADFAMYDFIAYGITATAVP